MRQILQIAGIIFMGAMGWLDGQTAPGPAPSMTAADEPLVKVVEKTLPAVVNITAEQTVRGRIDDPFSAFFGRYYTAPRGSLGTGVIVSADGYIVTCNHVVDGADNGMVKITLSNGALYKAKVLANDPDQDLALLKIMDSKDDFVFLNTTVLSPNLLGQTVVALGDPVGYQNSVSRGILSAKNRTISTAEGKMTGLIQTDAAINPGNSGGPMVDIEGKFVGICSAKASGESIGGLGFGIPSDVAAAWTADAIAVAKGEKAATKSPSLVEVIQKRFGMVVQDLTPDLAESLNLPASQGLLLSDVEKGSPADRAGIKPGMLLIRIGGVPVNDEGSIPRQLRRITEGDDVDFMVGVTVQRGDYIRLRGVNVTLKAQ